MDAKLSEAFGLLDAHLQGQEYRNKLIKLASSNILKIAKEAVQLEQEWRHSVKRTEELGRAGESEHSMAEWGRAKRLHRLRCTELRKLAEQMAMLMRTAAGDLVVDETTADTGLTAGERALIRTIQSGQLEGV